ncbi:hypothetical protein [Marinobacter salsuginis]|jgi:hypothetical protein|uniref:Uncharacterized protein n=1 Tax=Marinobacter salsuginis TaxID=418719 RepID=A0A5M3Q5T4_9GAMM|nr:hypothetical protein [Marinobacter salsuginis]GBO90441.1 hypothetical protein MSSD14B_41090 [Marinobacter salsuginis]
MEFTAPTGMVRQFIADNTAVVCGYREDGKTILIAACGEAISCADMNALQVAEIPDDSDLSDYFAIARGLARSVGATLTEEEFDWFSERLF